MLFQFLLVRLRVINRLNELLEDEPISIPSGAIKRSELIKWIEKGRIFQFLLVRLRAASVIKYCTFRGISIPSGAIKRALEWFKKYLPKVFQFLLVRLRERFLSTQHTEIQEFQFLLVRLRVTHWSSGKAFCLNFNSFWCD